MNRNKLEKIKKQFQKMGYKVTTHLEDEPVRSGGRRWCIIVNISKPYGKYVYIRSFYIQSENYPANVNFGSFIFHPNTSVEKIFKTVSFEFSQVPFGIRDFWHHIPSTDVEN